MVERGRIGGTCVNTGCVPSKALLAAAQARHIAADAGQRFPGIATTAGLVELARRFPADRSLMLLAEHQGRIVGGALAFRTDPASPAGGVTLRIIGLAPAYRGKGLGRRLPEEVEAAATRLGALEISPGASGLERGFYLRLGHAGRTRLRKQLPLSRAAHPRAEEWRHHLEELRQRRQRRLAAPWP
jgi:GNAT superfamily N-acetyltransferase